MLKKNLSDAINKQINEELYSAYLYLSMAAYFEDQNLPGFGSWMKAQAQEEIFHAMKFYGYVYERAGRVLLEPIKGPETKWKNPLHVFQEALKHEEYISSLINDIVALARKEKDFASDNFLQWFVAEQVEEESTADEYVNKLKMIGNEKTALYMLDQEMGQRVFTPPPPTA